MSVVKNIRRLLNAIFPLECLGCHCAGVWLCSACWQKLARPEHFRCVGCRRESTDGRLCSRCAPGWAGLERVWPLGAYANPLRRSAITRLKYEGISELAPSLAALLWCGLQHPAVRNACQNRSILIVPAPMNRWRQRARGVHHTHELAKELSKLAGWPMAPKLLGKRHRRAQAQLDPDEREQNIQGSIQLMRLVDLSAWTVLLIDDVLTSGATLRACAAALRPTNAQAIWAMTLAHG